MSAIFTITCWGCDQTVSQEYSSYEDSRDKIEKLKEQGWRRREFAPHADPWFCSENCALHSYNAVNAERIWQERNARKE